jgi:hypothetical protein
MTSLRPREAVLLMLVRFRKDFRVLRVPAQGRRERSSQTKAAPPGRASAQQDHRVPIVA